MLTRLNVPLTSSDGASSKKAVDLNLVDLSLDWAFVECFPGSRHLVSYSMGVVSFISVAACDKVIKLTI